MLGTDLLIGRSRDEGPAMAALPEGQEIFTVDEVADILRVNRRIVLKMLNNQQLAGVKVGRAWRVTREALEQFLAGGAQALEHP
jgi:excisionase family DNA binding protein